MARGRKAVAVPDGPIEGPWDLPEGWRWERLAEVTTEPRRGSPASQFSQHFRYLDVSSIDGAAIEPRLIPVNQAPSRARQFLEADDVVISGVRVYLRNIVRIPRDVVDVASTAFCVLRPTAEVDPAYLLNWITSDIFISWLVALQRGNSPPAVLDADVRSQLIPLPSGLHEQRRLAASIDALLDEITDGEAALAEVRAATETYRHALLKAAVGGQLTADWRKAEPAADTGRDLLSRILDERRKRWGADPKKARKQYAEPSPVDDAELPPIPRGWVWASLEQLSWSSQYGTSDKCDAVGAGEPVLRIPNLRGGGIDLGDLKFAKKPMELGEQDYAAPGDLFVIRTNGSEDLIGRTGLVDAKLQRPTFFASYLIRYRLLGDDVVWRWIRAFTQSAIFRGAVKRSIGSSAGQYNLSMGKLDRFAIAVPPRSEMQVALEVLEARAVKAIDLPLGDLRQSILAAAFRGELITEFQA